LSLNTSPTTVIYTLSLHDALPISMFKKTKRSVNFSVNIDYSNKIPRLDFIEMMEDSYETSIIDYLADEFTKDILSNPDQIKSKRSEEHTSELQSRENLVCRLLLEK